MDAELKQELKDIKKSLETSEKKSAIAFGIAIMVIGWNFAITASAAGKTDVTVASIILVILGFITMTSPSWKCIRRRFKSKS